MINVFQPALGAPELEAVREVFASNWVGKGSRTDDFEAAFAAHLGVPADQIISTNSCTEATFLADRLRTRVQMEAGEPEAGSAVDPSPEMLEALSVADERIEPVLKQLRA